MATMLAALLVPALLDAQAPGAASIAITPADSARELERRGEAAYRRGVAASYEEAIRDFAAALALYERLGDDAKRFVMLSNVAFTHNALGRPDSAMAGFARARALGERLNDRRALGDLLARIGQVHHGVGRLDSALVLYRQALAHARAAGDRRTEGLALNNVGLAQQQLGRLDSALVNLQASLAIRHAVGDSVGEGVTLNNAAQVQQTLGRPDSAIAYQRRALAIWRARRDAGRQGLAFNNVGYAFETLGANDSALVYYALAIPLLDAAGRRSQLGLALANVGRAHLALGAGDSAQAYLLRGLAIKREVGDRSGAGWPLTDLGRWHLARRQWDSALVYFDSALAILRTSGERERIGRTLSLLGDAQLARGGAEGRRRAVAYFDSAAAVRALVARTAGNDANRTSFAEQDVALFERWALAWLARTPDVGGAAAARAALAAVERGRAQALLDLVRASRASIAARDTAGQSAGADLVAEGTRLASAVTGARSAALSYLVTDDTLVVWLVSPDGTVRVARHAVGRDSLATLVTMVRAALGVDDADPFGGALEAAPSRRDDVTRRRGLRYAEAPAAALADLLLPAALAAALAPGTEVVVVPQGPLTLLPFAVLPLARGDAAAFGTALAIRYAPSLAALAEAESRASAGPAGRPTPAALRRALVVGDPVMPTVTGGDGTAVRLDPLAGARAEAVWVARRLGVAPVLGAAASESAVRARLARAPVVHLATHGYAYGTEAQARRSFVALAPGGGDDGVLMMAELLDGSLRLDVDLVVLSACQTGLGDVKRAEGTVGLQRAFLGAGVRSVLVSLWSVGDVATERLMRRFYDHWLGDSDGPSKAAALHRAQEDVRATPGLEHPRFWAAFELVGAR